VKIVYFSYIVCYEKGVVVCFFVCFFVLFFNVVSRRIENQDLLSSPPRELRSGGDTVIDAAPAPDRSPKVNLACNGHQDKGEGLEEEEEAKQQAILDFSKCKCIAVEFLKV